jgi:phosphoribosylpyrophosphate synthetase
VSNVIDEKFQIFSGSASPDLTQRICDYLGVEPGRTNLGRFSDGEIYFQILENVRGADVFVVQPCSAPVERHLMELLLMIDAFKRASAWRVTAVIPYYAYARQDRKDKPRVPISAKLVADLLETAGASRALTLDLHAPQIQGYFNVPVDHLFASPVLVEYFRQRGLRNVTVVSPDAGGVERARAFAKKLDAPLAIVDKRRVDVDVSPGADHRRHHRYRRDAGENGRGPAAGGGQRGVCRMHPRGALGTGGGAHLPVGDFRSGGHRFGAAERSGAQGVQDPGAERGRPAGAGHPVDP